MVKIRRGRTFKRDWIMKALLSQMDSRHSPRGVFVILQWTSFNPAPSSPVCLLDACLAFCQVIPWHEALSRCSLYRALGLLILQNQEIDKLLRIIGITCGIWDSRKNGPRRCMHVHMHRCDTQERLKHSARSADKLYTTQSTEVASTVWAVRTDVFYVGPSCYLTKFSQKPCLVTSPHR